MENVKFIKTLDENKSSEIYQAYCKHQKKCQRAEKLKQSKEELEKLEKFKFKQCDKYNYKHFFAIVYVYRDVDEKGRFTREIRTENNFGLVTARNTAYLLLDEDYNRVRKLEASFDSINEAESWVKEKIEEIQKELKRIQQRCLEDEKFPSNEVDFIA